MADAQAAKITLVLKVNGQRTVYEATTCQIDLDRPFAHVSEDPGLFRISDLKFQGRVNYRGCFRFRGKDRKKDMRAWKRFLERL